ncbi:MAG TPA: glycoside hydrolase family 44 protein [Opitutaceae bacterium]|nr:glycoside hydrolase family 44 protein [Opitutaceae bacterium]
MKRIIRTLHARGTRFIHAWAITLGLSACTAAHAQTPQHYLVAYDGTLQPSWVRSCWEANDGDLYTDFAATAPDRTGNTIEVRFGPGDAWNAFGLADRRPGWDVQLKYLNEFRTIEFDIRFKSSAGPADNLRFLLDDAGYSDERALAGFIPGWATMTAAQRYDQWHHVTIDLPSIHPTRAHFHQFLFFNDGEDQPQFYLADVKLGWDDDTTPPVITVGTPVLSADHTQLTLPFTTDEFAVYRVEFGIGGYSATVTGDNEGWSRSHSPILPGLTLGSTYQYRIVALDHRTDPAAAPNQGVATGTFVVPAAPTTPPTISNLAISDLAGNRAILSWNTDRPCTATLSYQKTGGTALTRTLGDLQTSRSFTLDLLEPSTAYTATVTVTDAFALTASRTVTFTTTASAAPTITITAAPAAAHPISPWIYGVNFHQKIPDVPRNLTFNRHGGNRWTAYNWENNASNAGSDWGPFSSDSYLSESTVPAEAARERVAADRAAGLASLITVQMQGYAAADTDGNVAMTDSLATRRATRFKEVVFAKGAPFTAIPSTADASVYMDEFVSVLRDKLGTDIYSDPVTPTFVSLDNEPDLWPDTHLQIQGPALTDPDVFIQRTAELSTAIKNVAPGALTFGPVNYGFLGIYNWQDYGSAELTSSYWFADKYLADLRVASQAAGRRLLDVYDIHWYSESRVGGTRIGSLTGTSLTADQIQAVVQSPRSFWDSTYAETSWVANTLGGPIYILRRLQDKIAAQWPGTRLALTEYEAGGNNHIAGALAQADTLGVFGQMDIFAANFWPTSDTYAFTLAGFKMYRDYDGALATFGDISLPTTSSDTALVSAYISRFSTRNDRYVIVAINRSPAVQDVAFAGLAAAGIARVFRLEGTSTTPAFVGEVPADLANWVVTLPPLSVSTIELNIPAAANYAAWRALSFSTTDLGNDAVSGPDADPDGAGVTNFARYAFGLPARGPVATSTTLGTTTSGGASYLTLTFDRRATASDLAYTVEASSDLVDWSTVTTIAPGTPAQVTAQDSVALGTAGITRRFLRVRVAAP